MDQSELSDGSQPTAKKRRAGNEGEKDRNAIEAASIASNQNQTADIFKLDIDCFEEVFDYLNLKDLLSVGKTCKRLQKVAIHIRKQNYPSIAYKNSSNIFPWVNQDC